MNLWLFVKRWVALSLFSPTHNFYLVIGWNLFLSFSTQGGGILGDEFNPRVVSHIPHHDARLNDWESTTINEMQIHRWKFTTMLKCPDNHSALPFHSFLLGENLITPVAPCDSDTMINGWQQAHYGYPYLLLYPGIYYKSSVTRRESYWCYVV